MPNHSPSRYFAHEKLDAYRHARRAVQIVRAQKATLRGLPGETAQQLERAVVGAHTNLCSGAAHHGAEARRHFKIALSEASEAGGAADLALDLGGLPQVAYEQLRETLLRLCACLGGLIR
jgi:four helix bundle protein